MFIKNRGGYCANTTGYWCNCIDKWLNMFKVHISIYFTILIHIDSYINNNLLFFHVIGFDKTLTTGCRNNDIRISAKAFRIFRISKDVTY